MKHIPLYEDFKNLSEKVSVDTSRYEFSHGKKPRGKGSWAFYFDRRGGEAIFTPQSMDYADAIKWAKGQAKEAGKTVVYVGESVNESLNEGFTSFADLEIAIRHHKDGNPYYDMTKLINVYNGLKSSDQIKAKKKYSDIFGVKESEVNESKKLTSSQLSNFLLDLIYTAAQYTSEDLESLAGQSPRDLDDAIKMVLDYIPSSKKKKFIDDAEKMIQLKKLDESQLNEEYDVSGLSRQDLNKILSHLDSNDISYDFDGRNEILEFDPTELDKKSQEDFIKMGLPINESRRSIIHPVIMQQRYLHAKGKKLVLPNISDIDHTRIVKWMGIHYYSNQYDIMMKGKDLEITIKKMSTQGIENLKAYLKTQDYINEASKIDVKDIKVGSILNFNDGEQWKVTKFIGNPSNPRGVFALPHGDTKKNYTSVALEFTIDELEKTVDSLNEATTSWAKLMKGVKSSKAGPWSLVATDGKKVAGQKIDIRTPDIIPAHYEAMRKEFPKAKIHVEDGTGAVVWTSN